MKASAEELRSWGEDLVPKDAEGRVRAGGRLERGMLGKKKNVPEGTRITERTNTLQKLHEV